MHVFAPAKINLYLHITQRLKNGYHALDSLVCFADIGDDIEITPAREFVFEVDGPFGGALQGRDIEAGPDSTNLVVKAVWQLARRVGRAPEVAVRLTKNLPLGAGIGGGSSDAAAVIWALCGLWDIPKDAVDVQELLASLGADVPVCFAGNTARIKGVGEAFDLLPALPEMPIVLVYPGKPCATQEVFKRFHGEMREHVALPPSFENAEALTDFLGRCDNDLKAASLGVVPEVENVLLQIDAQNGCDWAQMSGSGSCCFGLFKDENAAQLAAQNLAQENPDWWVQNGWIGRVERY